ALLYFGKVPVFVLPFVVQSLERGRRSGLIVPKFSLVDIVRTSRNHVRQIDNLGYYWAINDYLGAQVGLTWRSGAYTALLGDVDYKWTRQFLDGRFAIQQYWQDNGSTTFQLNTNNSWQPDERTRLAVSGNYAQSAAFVRETTVDPMEQTQNLASNLSLNRRFDWGTVALGSTVRQSIANGSLDMELPSFTISPNPITLFRAPSVEGARWYNNSTLQWSLTGRRTLETNQPGRQDQSVSNLNSTQSLTVGNLSISAREGLNAQAFHELFLPRDTVHGIPRDTLLVGRRFDHADWSASLSYQQHLIGQTILSPSVSLSQELVRNTAISRSLVLTNPDQFSGYVAGPMRLSVGAGLATTLFGFYPGFGPFSRIRHRLNPSVSYSYAPSVNQTAAQRAVFGGLGGLAQNTVTLSLNQTWEAKLKEPTPEKTAPADTTAADSAAQKSVPAEPEKVTLLSINTSAVTYDFARAASGQSGFRTTTLSNTITSDYLHGLSVQMTHELFDASDIDPQLPGNAGKLGKFSPRLTSLSTGFELGPDSWLARFLHLSPTTTEDTVAQGVQPGPSPQPPGQLPGMGGFTNNPQGTGHGPWRASIRYSFTRQPRRFISNAVVGNYPETTIIDPTTGLPIPISDGDGFFVPSTAGADGRAIQTLSGNLSFALTPNWGVQWQTAYSITDNRFSRQVLNFQRSLHRWQANFSYSLGPNGNSMFQFYVQLIDNQDLKAEYNQDYRAIDQRF
ncbi:MAG TPA: putative LPS assembly protein LptD, partial [Longimicrobiaceae bacterium]|nr:putative LPS assembly protein LptD [Longimicrobiaceae bacterium]